MRRLASLASVILFLSCIASLASVGTSSGGEGSSSVSDEDEAGASAQNSDSQSGVPGNLPRSASSRLFPDQPHLLAARLPAANGTVHATVIGRHLELGTAATDVAYREWDYVPSVIVGRVMFHCLPMFPHEATSAELETDPTAPREVYMRGRRLYVECNSPVGGTGLGDTIQLRAWFFHRGLESLGHGHRAHHPLSLRRRFGFVPRGTTWDPNTAAPNADAPAGDSWCHVNIAEYSVYWNGCHTSMTHKYDIRIKR
jgi:hypothetical protein